VAACRLACFILSALVTTSGVAAEFSVATDGSDAASGTLERPFATIQRAQEAVSPGNAFGTTRRATAEDFQSLEVDQMFAPRHPDGALPPMTFLHLADDSPLVDAGVDIGRPFVGDAPDPGAFEWSGATSPKRRPR
jgi:hypothetical protein